jgi:Domain of unknown function (DUF2357)/PD-(D/E)XK nuclease superfamily
VTRPLDAVRIVGARGDTIELRAPGVSLASRLWEPLSEHLTALPATRPVSPLAWDASADRECLSSLSVFERATLLATLSPATRWGPEVGTLATHLGDLASGHSLWSLTPRAFAGRWTLTAHRDDALCAQVELEVRTRKIDPATGWRALLDALAEADLALATRDLSPFEGAWSDDTRAPRSAFETFVLLRAIVEGPTLAHALRDIARDPVTGITSASRVVPAHRASRALPEELAARALTLDASTGSALERAPSHTLDVGENRFVLFALEGMARLAHDLATGARPLVASARLAASALSDHLQRSRRVLSAGPLAGVGALSTSAPLASSQLQRRRGYRELLAAWTRLADSPGPLRLDASSEAVGLVDAPRLYERWCALEVARALDLDADDAARLAAGGATIAATLDGRALSVASQSPAGARSYALAFRPDLTVTAGARRLHFDAKYQLDDEGEGDDTPRAAVAKMHAYRDAIEGTWGAYALYPGEGAREMCFDAPGGGGVGAVALRPGDTLRDLQRASVLARIRRFLSAE